MDCNETRRLIDADLDGELDLVRHLEVEAHLRTCPACARVAENARARRSTLQESLPRFTASPAFVEKIRRALPAARPGVAKPGDVIFPVWQVAGLVASLAFAVFLGYHWGMTHGRSDRLLADAVAEHVGSLQVDHLTDVVSSDQHTVKPWFAGKLDFSPPVVDLASAGFALAGGRLEYLGGHRAAALVFQRRQHAINLFIWPVGDMEVPSRAEEEGGYYATSWSRAGLNFVAVSDIPEAELEQFAEAFRKATR